MARCSVHAGRRAPPVGPGGGNEQPGLVCQYDKEMRNAVALPLGPDRQALTEKRVTWAGDCHGLRIAVVGSL